MVFCGAGSNNYVSKILHWLYNIKIVWTPKFACIMISLCIFSSVTWYRDIMQDCMLVNLTGLEDHWMAADLNIEHLIKVLKVRSCI